ncbi:MAG: tRNA-dihydrouridine synthase [Patescibacteria group bacterium]|nr:tRNA-dihydrouridine synthase [Patescibacteria group bacterium]
MWDKTPKPIFCLAPMAGVTDSAFRFICKKCGADIVYSEMASATALFFKPQKTLELLRFSLQERPYIVQLFGKKPEHFGKATRLISQGVPLIKYGNKGLYPKNTLQPPDGIDINFGCPAKKVFGHGSGAALMRKPVLAKKIIEAVTSNTKLPVSLKIRSELKTPQGVFPLLDFLKKIDINSLGVLAIMVHGRSYSQGFKGPINYQVVQNVKKYFQGTVIANGGIENIEDAKTMLAKTGADGIGLATGTYGNPLLFNQLQSIKQTSAKNKNLWVKKNQTEIALRHAHYAYKLKGERGILELRKHFLWYFKGIPNIKKLHPKIVSISTLEDVKEVIQDVHKLSKT